MPTFRPYRVFVSYSRSDKDLAKGVVKVLRSLGLRDVWDRDILPGSDYTPAIWGFISHAHLFMPILTNRSTRRPWVHEEIGYAAALNVPILPVVIGTAPGEMLSQTQAIVVDESLSGLKKQLERTGLDRLVFPRRPRSRSMLVEVADWPETRAELLAQYANRVLELDSPGMVRQRAMLSSFSIQSRTLADPACNSNDGSRPRTDYFRGLESEERNSLQKHASRAGCRLIISPHTTLRHVADSERVSRIMTVLEFLRAMPDGKVDIVIADKIPRGNLTIVGDWFAAESFGATIGGYRHTMFTWHAPTVLRSIESFDRDFEQLLSSKATLRAASHQEAIAFLNSYLAELQTNYRRNISSSLRSRG